jgi:mono/diheme cytochrome c family protein
MLMAVLAGCAQPNREASIQPTDAAAARRLYITKCAKCHKLYNPAKYSDDEWGLWMKKMSRKARLSPEQRDLLERYIADNLRRAGKI